MADLADEAQTAIDLEQRAALEAARALRPAQVGRKWCRDCDEPISPARQHAVPGADRCSFCQAGHEELVKAGVRKGGV